MTPSFVLLHRIVDLSFREEDGEAAAVAAEKNKGASYAATPLLREESTTSFLRSMTPDFDLDRPPKISTLKLRSFRTRQDYVAMLLRPYATVACADKSMLVVYGGSYRGPGSSRGCYLIYDAAVSGASTLASMVPPIPDSSDINNFAPPAVVRHPSSYVIAELAYNFPRCILPDAELYLWRSDSPNPQWEVKEVRLPSEVASGSTKHLFQADISFSFGTSMCWVDLLRGILIYQDDKDPPFRFIPLPADGCPEYGLEDFPNRPAVRMYRTAACVAGTIRLVAAEGTLEQSESVDLYRFVTWTLTPDLGQWKKDGVFYLKDIWASDKYIALGMENVMPICPIVSPLENGVVYGVVNDIEEHNINDDFGVHIDLELKNQYVVGLDILNKQIISVHGRPTPGMDLWPDLLATDFCAYLQGPKRGASEVVESGKRPRAAY